MRLDGHVLEGAVAPVVIQDVLVVWQSARAAHHRSTLPHARRPVSRSWGCGHVEINVVRNEKIEVAVAVVVHKGAACAPLLAIASNSGFRAHQFEYTVIVVIQPVLAVVRNVEVFPSI